MLKSYRTLGWEAGGAELHHLVIVQPKKYLLSETGTVKWYWLLSTFTSSPVQTDTKDREEQDIDVLESWLVAVPQYIVVPCRALLSTGCQSVVLPQEELLF